MVGVPYTLPTMKLVFTKGSGKFDRLDITADAGPLAPIECPKQGIIPHDMMHFAVESETGACGFLGLAAAGGDTGVRVGTEDAHARAVERLVETFQAEAWDATPVTDADFIAMYHVTCAARGDTPFNLDAATLATIRARVAELTVQWRAVPVGGTLALIFNAPKPG
jgi:hypothetical protein